MVANAHRPAVPSIAPAAVDRAAIDRVSPHSAPTADVGAIGLPGRVAAGSRSPSTWPRAHPGTSARRFRRPGRMPAVAGPSARVAPPAEPGSATIVGPIERPSRTSGTGRSGSPTTSSGGPVPGGAATSPEAVANLRIVPAVGMPGTSAAAGVGWLGDPAASVNPDVRGPGASVGLEGAAVGDPVTDV